MKRLILVVGLLGCSSSGGESRGSSEAEATAKAREGNQASKTTALSGEEIAKSLGASALGAASVVVHTEASDPNHLLGRPGQYVAKVNWTKNGNDCSVEVYPDLEGAKKRVEYIDALGKGSTLFLQYTALHERKNAVIHCDHGLTPTEFAAAKTWLTSL